MKSIAGLLVATISVCAVSGAFAQQVKVSADGKAIASVAPGSGRPIDYVNARPVPLPQAKGPLPSQIQMLEQAAAAAPLGAPGFAAGAAGTQPITVKATSTPVPKALTGDGGISSQEYGSGNQPYATARAPNGGGLSPYWRAGKLFFNEPSGTYVCSASLIKPGIVVTAAHCVANYGQSQFYSGWTFYPDYSNGNAPYGAWSVTSATVMTAYYNGSDNCYQYGVICPDDVALLVLSPQNGSYIGSQIGYFGYGWNGYSYVNGNALIGQLGYPVALDNGLIMEQNFSQGTTNSTYSNNTIIGSLMTGGSSGGPWLVNLGKPVVITGSGTGFGNAANGNVVVGVTSWGYTDTSSSGPKQMGASPFTSNNIVFLVNTVCSSYPDRC